MTEETIKEIFLEIAFREMETGKEIKIEKGKDNSYSKMLGGGLSESVTDYDSLSMNVFQPSVKEEIEEEETENEETD